jgi:hypothetical protein
MKQLQIRFAAHAALLAVLSMAGSAFEEDAGGTL